MVQALQPWCFAFASPATIASFWQTFGLGARAAEPAMRTCMQTQCEAVGFAANRARAMLELPSALARCRTPQDVMAAQMQFWQTANREYLEFGRRATTAWQSQLSLFSRETARQVEIARDRLILSEVTPDSREASARDRDDGSREWDRGDRAMQSRPGSDELGRHAA